MADLQPFKNNYHALPVLSKHLHFLRGLSLSPCASQSLVSENIYIFFHSFNRYLRASYSTPGMLGMPQSYAQSQTLFSRYKLLIPLFWIDLVMLGGEMWNCQNVFRGYITRYCFILCCLFQASNKSCKRLQSQSSCCSLLFSFLYDW